MCRISLGFTFPLSIEMFYVLSLSANFTNKLFLFRSGRFRGGGKSNGTKSPGGPNSGSPISPTGYVITLIDDLFQSVCKSFVTVRRLNRERTKFAMFDYFGGS